MYGFKAVALCFLVYLSVLGTYVAVSRQWEYRAITTFYYCAGMDT